MLHRTDNPATGIAVWGPALAALWTLGLGCWGDGLGGSLLGGEEPEVASLESALLNDTPFTRFTVDSAPPASPYYKMAGDINGDGTLDLIVAGASGPMVWYASPGWTTKTQIATGGWKGVRGDTGDIDNDGDTDIVMGGVVWFRNPRVGGGSWTASSIDSFEAHDALTADLDADGRLDVVARNQSAFDSNGNAIRIYRQVSPTSWTKRIISCPHGEGIKLHDLDRDGDPDIVIGSRWYENSGDPVNGPWTEHIFTAAWTEPDTKVEVGDFNNDGRNDVVLTPSELAGGTYKIAWYQAPVNPKAGSWSEHVVVASIETVVHGLGAGDFNRDGKLDLAYAEMHQGGNPDEVVVLLNEGGGTAWHKQVLSTQGSHDIVVADFNRDGKVDIAGANHAGTSPVEIWRNDTSSKLSLASFARRVVDASRPATAVFVYPADLDGDGKKDIVSGGWWYRNPGTAGGAWTRNTIGSPFNNVAAVYDLDGDGDLDLLGTQGSGSSSNHNFAWARNAGNGNFTVLTNIATGGSGDFLQGVAAARFKVGGPIEVALSWHNGGGGVHMLTVPADPSSGTWSFRTLSTTTESEQLSAGDINRDGDKDLLLGTKWLRNDGASFSVQTLFATNRAPDRSRLADIDGDGRLDAVIGYEAISVQGVLAWYRQPATASSAWTEHLISSTVVGPMSVDVADFDADGDLDVVAGEHHLASPSSARLLLFENGGSGTSWTAHAIHTGDEHHDGAQAADIDGDGDLDVVSIGWGHQRVHLYENLATGGSSSTTPPAAPTSLTATAVSTSQINLSWTDASSNETEFQVLRSTSATSGFTPIGTVGAGITSYQSTGLVTLTPYYYRVRAANKAGASGNSNTASATTLPTDPDPVPQTGLQLWLKADVGLTLSGSAVSAWADQSGNGRNAAQATAGSRPTLLESAFGKKPAIQFDGVDDHLTFQLPINGWSEMTLILVAAATADRTGGSTNAANAALFWNETASWGTVYLSPFQSNVKFRFGTTQTGNLPSYTRRSSLSTAFSTSIAVKRGTTDSLYVNGALVVSQGGKLARIAACQSTGNLGRGYNNNTFFPGRIAEVLVYDRALTDAERQSIEQYLTPRYSMSYGTGAETPEIDATFVEGGCAVGPASPGAAPGGAVLLLAAGLIGLWASRRRSRTR